MICPIRYVYKSNPSEVVNAKGNFFIKSYSYRFFNPYIDLFSEFYFIIIFIKKLEFDKMVISISPKSDSLSIFSFPF